MFADMLYFLLRYIPWWAVPSFMICFQFANIYFAKEVTWLGWLLAGCCVVNAIAIIWYIYAGSPHRSVILFQQFIDSL